MSNSTTVPATEKFTIRAGATFRELLQRSTVDYKTQYINGVLCKMDGTPVPDGDIVPEDYTDCTAILELRDADTNALLATFTTADNTITFTESVPGKLDTIVLYMSPTATGALTAFASAVGQLELRRPYGDIERQYELTFSYSAQTTAAEPPASP